MDCLNLKDLLAAQDGLLSESAQEQVAVHLTECPRCRELERSLRDVLRLLPLSSTTTPLPATGSCPAEIELLDYAAGQLPEARRTRLERHLVDCRLCLAQVAALLRPEPETPPVAPEFRHAVRQAEQLVEEPSRPPRSFWQLIPAWRYTLATAATVALVAAAFVWNEGRKTPPPAPQQVQAPVAVPSPAPSPVPGPEEPTLLAEQKRPQPPGATKEPETHVRNATGLSPSSLRVLWPREGERVDRPGLEIRWQAVPGARLYNVTLLNHKGDLVWEGQAQGDSLRVPDDLSLLPGERYFVWVTTHIQDNETVRSPSVAFEVRPAPSL